MQYKDYGKRLREDAIFRENCGTNQIGVEKQEKIDCKENVYDFSKREAPKKKGALF